MGYPMEFTVRASSPQGIASTWTTSAEDRQITAAIPPEFEGPGGGFSPEDLFALAMANCFIATFKVYAEKSKLVFETIAAQVVLTVDIGDDGRPWMAKAKLSVQVAGSENPDKTSRLLEKASRGCLVLNSIKTEKTFSYELV